MGSIVVWLLGLLSVPLNAIGILWPGLVMVAISTVYYATDRGDFGPVARLVSASPGVIATLLYAVGMAVWMSGMASRSFAAPFAVLYLIPPILVLAAFVLYRGRPWIHLLQVPNLGYILYSYFVGGMAITGDWL
jgi:hypothetical protein